MAESMPVTTLERPEPPRLVIAKQTPLPKNALTTLTQRLQGQGDIQIIKLGRLFDRPGQSCELSTPGPRGPVWDRVAFLAKTASGRSFYGRPALDLRESRSWWPQEHYRGTSEDQLLGPRVIYGKLNEVVARTGIIIDADKVQAGAPQEELAVAFPGRRLARFTIGESFRPCPEAGELTTLVAFYPQDLTIAASLARPYQYYGDLEAAEANLDGYHQAQDKDAYQSLWKVATQCLNALVEHDA